MQLSKKKEADYRNVILNDFNEAGQKAILSGSYGMIYVKGCELKPILDAKEWIEGMKKGKMRK